MSPLAAAVLAVALGQCALCGKTFRDKCAERAALGSYYYRGSCYLPSPYPNPSYPTLSAMVSNLDKLCTHMAGHVSGWAVLPDRTVMTKLKAAQPAGWVRYGLYRLDWPARTDTKLTWHWLQPDGRKWPQVYDTRYVDDNWNGDGRNGGPWAGNRLGDYNDGWAGSYMCQYRGPLTAAVRAANTIGVEAGTEADYALEQHDGMRSVGGCMRLCYGVLLCQAFSYSRPLSVCRLHRLLPDDAYIPLALVANSSFAYYELQPADL